MISHKARIALLVDNPLRDLKPLVLLAIELSMRGASCYLVPQNLAKYELSSLPVDFVLFNHLRKNNSQFIEDLLDAGIRVAVLDTEGGVMPNYAHYAASIPENNSLRDRIHAVYVWGNNLATFLLEQKYYRQEQIVVTGSPRFDFYADPWKQLSIQQKDSKDVVKPIILITGNFSICNPAMTTPEREVEIWVQAGHERKQVIEWQKLNHQTMLGMVDLANSLAEHFPDSRIIYRPHPFERVDTYYSLLRKLKNLQLNTTGSVDEWVCRANVVIQRSSTTGIEAAIAGIPSLIPEWLPVAFPIQTVNDISIMCSTKEALFMITEGLISGSYTIPNQIATNMRKIVQECFFAIDGLSYRRVADDIIKCLAFSKNEILPSKCKDIHYEFPQGSGISTKIQFYIKKKFEIPVRRSARFLYMKQNSLKWDQSIKAFDSSDVLSIANEIIKEYQSANENKLILRIRQCNHKDYKFNYDNGRSILVCGKENDGN
ncbi:MAG: hypothetical protein F9K48_04115 [Candidatus Brocadia sp.]|nr:MAG: hypothetical protein F9K48_04115 [Candidatus Brocadia sp.]